MNELSTVRRTPVYVAAKLWGGADRRVCLGMALLWWLVAAVMHLPFSIWLVRSRELPWGRVALMDFLPQLLTVSALGLVAWVGWRVICHPRPWRWLALWVAWLACVALMDRTLTYSLAEYFHYPQYAVLAWLLAHFFDPQRRARVPGRILIWTALLGGLDELSQYLWTTAHYSEYLDFNDFLTNLLAAVAGVLVYYGVSPQAASETPAAPRGTWWAMGILSVVVALGMVSGRVSFSPPAGVKVPAGGVVMAENGGPSLYLQRLHPSAYGRYNQGPYRGRYWILSPGVGLVLLGVALAGFAGAIRHTGARPCGRIQGDN